MNLYTLLFKFALATAGLKAGYPAMLLNEIVNCMSRPNGNEFAKSNDFPDRGPCSENFLSSPVVSPAARICSICSGPTSRKRFFPAPERLAGYGANCRG